MSDIQTLAQIPLFKNMDEHEIAGVLAIMSDNIFAPGQVIIHENDESKNFHIIVEGNVQFLTADASGNELKLDEAGPGGYFGELSMLTGLPRLVRVRALEQVRTLGLNRDQFQEFLLKHPHAGLDVLAVLSHRLYNADKLLRQSVSRNVNDIEEERLTLGQRIADGFAATMGSWPFIIIQSCILIVWVVLNCIAWHNRWDPYPFILLNLALSFQAAYAAPIIMMSQNRSQDKDRLAAEIDHQVNVKAEIKVGLMLNRMDDIERSMHFLHRQQCELFRDGDGRAGAGGDHRGVKV